MKLLVRTLVFLFIVGCNPKKETGKTSIDNLNLYQEYITEVSHGIISAKADVRVVLSRPIDSWESGKELDGDLLVVFPKTSGKVIALDSRTIAFIPEAGFLQDSNYRFTLNLGSIISGVPKELRDFNFELKTLKQQFNVYTQALQSYSKDYQYMEGQLKSADQLSLENAKQLLEVKQQGKKVSVKFDESISEGTQFYFKIDSIQRFTEDTDLEVVWDGTGMDIESVGKNTIKIPGKSNFSILDVSLETGENQIININFSDPLKKGQNFKGLVVLEGDGNLKYDVVGNTLKIYPSKEMSTTLQLEVFEGIESIDGYKLKTKLVERVAFEQIKPEVRLLSNGTILPSSNNLKINFEAVNLKSVDITVYKIFEDNVLQFLQGNDLNGSYNLKTVARPIASKKLDLENSLSGNNGKWSAHAIDLETLITSEVGAIYRVELGFKPSYSLFKCDDTNFEQETSSEDVFDQETENSSWDGVESYYEDYYFNYDWNQRDNPCHTSYYYDKTVGANVLASDLGVIVKQGVNKSYFVAVNDIISTDPVAGAKVTFYNYQQQPIGQVTTELDGTALFDTDNLAYFAVAESNGHKTYVKLNDGNALSVSKFNIDGVALQKGIKGFIFGERGVWRPGDELFLSFILNDKANKLPVGHPVKLELIDPYNKIVHREIRTNSLNNFYSFVLRTDENAPTGNWIAKVSVGGATFTKTIRIETIKPNRLKIKTAFENEVLTSGRPIKGRLEVAWLHGAVAKNLKADITARFNVETTTFKNFPAYVFDDPTRAFATEDQIIFNSAVNAEGKADFSISPQINSQAPGMLTAAFITKVYENGGDFSTDVFTKQFSPFSTYVGLNVPKGDKTRGMLLTDQPHKFELVTVDEMGNAKSTKNLKVAIYKVSWRWWWETSADNLSNFSSSEYQEKVFEETISTNASGKASFNFELKYPDWGRYLVRVEDPKGGHATGKTIYIDWPGWAGKSMKNDPSAATMLIFSTDKEVYKVGETATVTFPGSEGGRALVTIENGSEVLNSLWVEAKKGETKFEIPISELYTPNVYINISLLQPHASTINDSPIRMYGVVPISVEDPLTKLQPEIAMPDVLSPQESITLKVNEKHGRAMTYSIAMVDEGLLDLTRYKTPNPWSSFYAREALGVKSWDVYDDVIGAFGGRINQVFAIGGDGELAGAKNKKANRFEPIVVFLGPFSLDKGETKAHKIDIPKYIGSVRTMVIAGNSGEAAYGVAEKATPVRKPLMVLASLPRKITPGETVTLPVTVFAMENKVKEVTLQIKADPSFSVVGKTVQNVSFSQPDEKMAYFQLKVADYKGIGKVVVEAYGNGEKASFEVPIDVVNPNPLTTVTENIILEAGSSGKINFETFGIPGSNGAEVEFSTLPPMNFNGRMQYLIQYPHGCLEQTISGAFPQLFIADIFDIRISKKKEIQQNIESAIKRVGSYQTPGGGFAYWPGQNYADDWSSSYVGHFLLEAEKKGYVLPLGFRSSWVNYQQNIARQWRSGTGYSDLAQAYRLYTLALSGNADIASMNRLRETLNLSNEGKFRLAAAYGLVGQEPVAQQIIKSANYDFSDSKYDDYTYGSSDRNRAMALETFVLLKDKLKAQEMAKNLAKRLSSEKWMSTQSTSYCLLALAKFADMVGGKGIKASITVNGSKSTINTEKTLSNIGLGISTGTNAIDLKNTGENLLYISMVKSGILPVGEERELQRNLVANVTFKGRNGIKLDPSSIMQGTDFVAEVSLTNTKAELIKNVALSEIFPSGWEIVNTRFTDFGDFAENEVTYTDLRDDRANFYFDLKKNETKTFTVLLNASYLGRYYMPGIQAEAMYNNDYVVRTKGQWVEVVQ
ncbi:MG2 domain-containing protein [Arenibacter sp. F20364]|uniref:alpha-2-macroglobulin family protein n=1 Tax=Arenibacter sp. F20364 TaxID=2926415 RepID=UPI001FF5F35F|nr:MG2 domain-containing protein [Arenibacter sp. F20364]MCK0188652.1 MG2 domain-containing protein [Arenibacter sp. F20364]